MSSGHDVLGSEDSLLHGGVRDCVVRLELAEDSTRLVRDVDEHRQDLAHHQRHRTWAHGLRQQHQPTLAQVRTREAAVVEVDLRTPAARSCDRQQRNTASPAV